MSKTPKPRKAVPAAPAATEQPSALATAIAAALATADVAALTTASVDALATLSPASLTSTDVQTLQTAEIASLATAPAPIVATADVAALATADVAALTSTGPTDLSQADYEQYGSQLDRAVDRELGALHGQVLAGLTASFEAIAQLPPEPATVSMVRSEPMFPGGPTAAEVHRDEVEHHRSHGWTVR